MEPRLRTEIWIKAHIRRCQVADIPVYLRRRGDPGAGGILLKINGFARGCVLLEPTRSITGRRAWMRLSGPEPVDEATAEATIAKRLGHDPDLWVLEVEDPEGRHCLDEPVI